MDRYVPIEVSEGSSIEIGEDSMLSHNIQIFSTDSHTIIDLENHRINNSQAIKIGKHVWIGMKAMILKSSRILDKSIIVANSVYTIKSTERQNCIYAGNPAKEIISKINWKRELI